MFSKFKIEKPEYVLYKRGRTHFEAERSIVSLPLLEAYDERIRHLLAENNRQATELVKKRSEVFQLQQELQLLREEVARNRLQVNPAKKHRQVQCQPPQLLGIGQVNEKLEKKENQTIDSKCRRNFASGI